MDGHHANGGSTMFSSSSNGMSDRERSDSFDIAMTKRSSGDGHAESGVHRSTILRDTTTQVSSKAKRELGSSYRKMVEGSSDVHQFLDYVASLRLRDMPHRGSKWDRILQWAEYFASAVHHFTAAQSFEASSEQAARLIWGSCHVLLELGMQRLDLVHKAFALFNDAGRVLAFSTLDSSVLSASGSLQQTLSNAYADLVQLVVDVALHYSTGGTLHEFDTLFSHRADMFFSRKESMTELLWKQTLHSSYTKEIMVGIEQIRRFLSPSDDVVQRLAFSQLRSRSNHVEFTCEWFDQMLHDFTDSNDKVYLITGKSGCGKSVLSQWIVERLRRWQEKESYDVLSFFIQGDVTTEASSLSVARGILLQLFDSSIGNIDLYERIAALALQPAHDALALEKALWAAVEIGLKHKHTVLVVDGLDQLTGGDDVSVRVLDSLHHVTSKCHGSKAIVLSEPLKKPGSNRSRLLSIDKKLVHEDMERVLEVVVASTFLTLSRQEKSTIVHGLVSLSNGSFSHALLVLEMAKRQGTLSDIMKTLDSAPDTLAQCVHKLFGMLDTQQRDTRSLLAWMLAAERPLTISEIGVLLAVDVAHLTTSIRINNVESDLHHAVGPLIRVDDGVVRFKHPLIRRHLIEMAASVKDFSNKDGRFPFNIQEAHYDLVNRCLADVKISLTEHIAPSVEPVSSDFLVRLFQRHSLLRYTARYWSMHFKHSPMYQKDGKHKFTNEFKNAFPASTGLATLENSCWHSQMLVQESADFFDLALQLRRSLVPQHKESIFLTLVALSRSYQRLDKTKEASGYFSDAYYQGQSIFGKDSSVLAAAAAGYIATTQSKEKIEVREEMLQYLVLYQKQVHGASSLMAIKYTRMLVEVYKQSKKIDLAIELQEELYQMCIEHYGMQHSETTSVHRTLMILLKDAGRTDQLTRHEVSKWESIRNNLSLSDAALIGAAMEMVSYHESHKQLDKAEQIITELWQSLSQASQGRRSATLQERKMQIAMEYQKFLHKHGRHEDSQNVLIGIWTEYRDKLGNKRITTTDMSEVEQSIILAVGRRMQEFGSLEMAKTIFNSLWSYSKRTNQQTSSIAVESAMSLSTVSKEIMEKRISSSSTDEDTSDDSISDLEDMFDSITTTTTTTTTTPSTSTDTSISKQQEQTSSSARSSVIATAETLTSFYEQQNRFAEATRTTIKALQIAWPAVLTTSTKTVISLPSNDNMGIILTSAKRLANLYFKQKQISKSEAVLVHIFHSTKSLGVQNTHFRAAAFELVQFYETVFQFEKAMDTLVELYTLQNSSLKHDDAPVIQTAYRLARLCRDLQMNENAKKYFREIVQALTTDKDVLRSEGVEAAVVLCTLHHEARQWEKSRELYARVWKTFVTQRERYHWAPELVEKLYGGYFTVLEKWIKVDEKTLLQVTTEYRQRVVEIFGETHELSVKATLQLAAVYERSEEHREKAISMYENALSSAGSATTTTTTVQKTTLRKLTQSRQRLANLYSKQSKTSAKGVSIIHDEVRKTATSHGYASSQMMEQLTELVAFCTKNESKESRTTAVDLLQTTIREIVVKEKSTQKQVESAHSIVQMYKQLNDVQMAQTLLRSLRRQVITDDYDKDGKFSLVGAGQHSFAFIVAFEEALLAASESKQRSSYSELMAILMTQRLLHQSYTRVTKSDTRFDLIFTHGSRLVTFLQRHNRTDEHQKLSADLLKRFARAYQASETSTVLRDFYDICISEMGGDHRNTDDLAAVVSAASISVRQNLTASRFREAFELAGYIDTFMHLHDGAYASQPTIETAFKLALWLSGRGGVPRSPDKKLATKMHDLSASILREVLRAIDRLDIKFTDLPQTDLNDLVGLLGDQRNWEALETILATAWSSRLHSSQQATTTTTLTIGARLAQVRFLLGDAPRRAQALRLAEDMAYNLRRVWGLGDPATQRAFRLLAALHAGAGEHARARSVHDKVLRGTLDAVEEGAIGKAEGAQAVADEWEALRRDFGGGWGDGSVQAWNALQWHMGEVFGGERAWEQAGAAREDVAKWKKSGGEEKAWMPESWEFLEKETMGGEGGKVLHKNNLRRTSGLETSMRPHMHMLAYPAEGGQQHHHHHHHHHNGGHYHNGGGAVRAMGEGDGKAQEHKAVGLPEIKEVKGVKVQAGEEVKGGKGQKVQTDEEVLQALEGGAVGGGNVKKSA